MANKGQYTALITGASSGFGVEFARLFAADGFNVVLVARSVDKLNALAEQIRSKYGVGATVLPKDLAHPAAPREIFEALQAQNIIVDALVNNAGFASYGEFTEIPEQKDMEMVQVNITALTHLAKLFVPGMVARKRGWVLNVASTAAFQAGPLMAVYYATKAYVLSLSEALAEEVAAHGVKVSALCPGPTETGFQQAAQMQESKLVQGGLMDAATVAQMGYRKLMRGQRVVVPGLRNAILALTPRFLPRKMVTRTVMNMQARVGH